MDLEYDEWPFGQPLSDAYARRSDPRLSALFGYRPEEENDWRKRSEWLDAHADDRADARRLADVLLHYNRRFGRNEKLEARIADLAQGAHAIAGGQQAGLWSGPLMVIHKAVTLIRYARLAEHKLGRPVVPVFWIAGEDHDWDEANHTYVLRDETELRKLSVTRPAYLRTSVSRTPVHPDQWREALQELAAVLPDSVHKPELLAVLHRITAASASLSEQFAGILHWLFADEGLVLLDADDPALRRLESPMFVRMIAENDRLEVAYAAAESTIRELGYPIQAEAAPGAANLFLFRDGGSDGVTPLEAGDRVLLFKEDGDCVDRKGTLRIARDELLALAEHSPERFSNNVLTRPLMQDYVLPVLATVLGPGEVAYWAATGQAFRAFGMQMPIVVPRMSFTLVDGTSDKYMKEFGLGFPEIRASYAERREAWLAERDTLALAARFEETRSRFDELYEPLLALLPELDAGLGQVGRTNRERILREIDYLQSRAKEAHRRKHEVSLRRLDRIACRLWPEDKPQERLLNFSVFWGQYGRDWLHALLHEPLPREQGHYILYL